VKTSEATRDLEVSAEREHADRVLRCSIRIKEGEEIDIPYEDAHLKEVLEERDELIATLGETLFAYVAEPDAPLKIQESTAMNTAALHKCFAKVPPLQSFKSRS